MENLFMKMKGDAVPEGNGFGEFLNMKEAANYIHVSLSTMEKYSANRLIPKYRPNNGKVYFKKSELDSFMDSCRRASSSELAMDFCYQLRANKFSNPLKRAV